MATEPTCEMTASPPASRRSIRIRTIAAFLVGTGVGIIGVYGFEQYYLIPYKLPEIARSMIPQVSGVREGFVDPSKLEIQVRDVDGEGTIETYCIYNGKKFFFKEDESGRPICVDYK